MRTPIPQKFAEIISRNNGLQMYLDSLLENKAFTPRSWLYDGQQGNPYLEPDDVLKKWKTTLQTLENGTDFERNVYQFDIAQESKWGPQGGHAPVDDLLDDIVMPSFQPPEWSLHPAAFGSEEWEQAIENVVFKYTRAGVHDLYPRTYERVVDDMRARDTLESNSGWPDFTRRNLPEVKSRAIADAKSGAWRDYPAILLFRRYNGKTRQVWMFPMATNIVEGSWFQPLTDAIMKTNLADHFFSPWKGFSAVCSLITQEYPQAYAIAASDFSSTDAHFQLAASEQVLKVLTRLFKPEFADELTESVRHMHSIPLIISPTDMLVGEHGVASGSNWTNFIETIFDDIFGEYTQIMLAKDAELAFLVYALFAIGDDEAWIIPLRQKMTRDGVSPTDVIAAFPNRLAALGRSVGQEVKAEKTMSEADKVKSLQRLFQRGYTTDDGKLRAVYSTIRALKSSVYPERQHHRDWSSDMFCARQFMILENCVDHPLFHEFVRFICKGNRHLVPFARYSEHKLNSITRAARLVPGLNPTYNQEKRDLGLAMFESIQYAKTL